MGKSINIFDFATGELTNDAMVCWLVSWADNNESKYIEYKKLSVEILNLFTQNINIAINKVEVKQQYNKIDVLVEINDTDIIIIEDKTNSEEHSNQLVRYRDMIEKDENYKSRNKHYVYLKIGNESKYKSDEIVYDHDKLNIKGKYINITRSDLLSVLNKYKYIEDNILQDYIEYLTNKEDVFNSYRKSNDLSDWKYGWEGYFHELQEVKNIKVYCYGSVSNVAGGFLGFWWNYKKFEYINEDKQLIVSNVYLQIEAYPWRELSNARITLKLECEEKKDQNLVRDLLWEKVNLLISGDDYFKKTRFSKGRFMTILERVCDTRLELEDGIKRFENLLIELESKGILK